jgi:hypothetical protein
LAKLSCILLIVGLSTTSCTKTNENQNNNHDTTGTPQVKPAEFNVNVSTIAGKIRDHGNAEDGTGASARFWNPTKMVFDPRNNMLYVADGTTIRSIDQQNNVKTYMPLGTISNFNEIEDLDLAPGTGGGNLYVITKENDLLKVEPTGNSSKTTRLVDRVYGGNATGPLNAGDHFDLPFGMATGKNGEIYFFNTAWATMHRITLTGASTGIVEPFAGKPTPGRSNSDTREVWPFYEGQGESATFGTMVHDICADGNGNIYVADYNNDLVRMVTPEGKVSSLFPYKGGYREDKDGPVANAQAYGVDQVSASKDGSYIFFISHTGLRVVRPGQDVSHLVGGSDNNEGYQDGSGKVARLATVIGGIAATPDGKTVYVSEPYQKVIRKVIISEP